MGASRRQGVSRVHRPAYRRLCELLREWRKSAGLTQRDLAAKLKQPRSYVSKSEIAERRIDPLELVIWCRTCGVEPVTAIRKVEKLV